MVKKLLFTLSIFMVAAVSAAPAPPQAASAISTEAKSTQYGRFAVVPDESGGQQILGGRFKPSPLLSMMMATKLHVIVIDYTTKELSYYQKNGWGTYSPIIGFAVVTPAANSLPFEMVRGRVTKIDTAPVWCPMQGARAKYPGLPLGCLPFGHPQNEMGAAKFEIRWDNVRGYEAVRLHGTKGYASGNFWEEETLGCTQLHNDAIKELITILGPRAVREGIEVILYRGKRG